MIICLMGILGILLWEVSFSLRTILSVFGFSTMDIETMKKTIKELRIEIEIDTKI